MHDILFKLCLYLLHTRVSHSFQSNLYFTESLTNQGDHHCLYYYAYTDKPIQQIYSYCIRYALDSSLLEGTGYYEESFTFKQLKNKNITSQQLYEWSAPIDLIENYQHYLEDRSDQVTNVFYNCSFPWFGTRCQFSFGLSKPMTSGEAIHYWINRPLNTYQLPIKETFPCYTHIKCIRTGSHVSMPGVCLDWREICDGKIDCLDSGADEEHCWQLEWNECNHEQEYRCLNGLCIPHSFLRDDRATPDCLDGSDESYFNPSYGLSPYPYWYFNRIVCQQSPTFRCEDRQCHWTTRNLHFITCGQGDCFNPFIEECSNHRNSFLIEALFTAINVTNACHRAFICGSRVLDALDDFSDYCENSITTTYTAALREHCPKLIILPVILFGHVQFVYDMNQSRRCAIDTYNFCGPHYICYRRDYCEDSLFSNLNDEPIKLLDNGSVCRSIYQFNLSSQSTEWNTIINRLHQLFYLCSTYHKIIQPNSNTTQIYRCQNSSQVISRHRLFDRIVDCIQGDDELPERSCFNRNKDTRFTCTMNKKVICLKQDRLNDGKVDCDDGSDEPNDPNLNLARRNIFSKLCDGYLDLKPILFNGENITDESQCNEFPCNNSYTRCDGLWNCPDGADEVNCEQPSMCPQLHHLCISKTSGDLTCLSIRRVNDGIIDCEGAIDERQICRQQCPPHVNCGYYCQKTNKCISSSFACFNPPICPFQNGTQPKFCERLRQPIMNTCQSINLSIAEQMVCNLAKVHDPRDVYLPFNGQVKTLVATYQRKLDDLNYASYVRATNYIETGPHPAKDVDCNRGVPIFRQANENNRSTIICLCPPSYYGQSCQFQNQRVSIVLQLLVSSDWRTVFTVVLILRNDADNQLESYDQINYLPVRDCLTKFNIYLLYRDRPKNFSANYSVLIEVFNQQTAEFRGSWIFPIQFSFLPVYPLAIQLSIPVSARTKDSCNTLSCGKHGSCVRHINTQRAYCRCQPGWFGRQCQTSYECRCSSNGVCLAPNLCLCKVGYFGPRCYLSQPPCKCQNQGRCVMSDARLMSRTLPWCICPEHVSGSKCENQDNKIEISFEPDLSIPDSIFFHFIRSDERNDFPNHVITFKKIPVDLNTANIYSSIRFHLLFVRIESHDYHLLVFQKQLITKSLLQLTVTKTNRCPSVKDLFDKTIFNIHRLQLLKQYHHICHRNTHPICFHDNQLMCICDDEFQQAICFPFFQNSSRTVHRINPCENNGHFFADNDVCPTSSICACPDCFYGSRCQFSSRGFSVSLDTILGYHVRPYQSFSQQTSKIKITLVVMTCVFACGIISNLCSILTFHNKETRKSASGFYLLLASYSSLLVIIVLAVKFYFLILQQMNGAVSQLQFGFYCVTLEYLIRVLVSISDWLTACVSMERAFTAVASKTSTTNKIATAPKRMIAFVVVTVFLSYIHDPIHRVFVHDEGDQRTWCMVDYSLPIQRYNWLVMFIHLSAPFIINIISAFLVIFSMARRRSVAQKQKSYRQHLLEQFSLLKYTVVSPFVLVILAIPRLIMSFVFDCLKSPRNPWLYLVGFYASFSPSMFIFSISIIASKTFRQGFRKSLTYKRRPK